ncbi:hypothetical protein QQ020_28100 [Fulvivirgaceae bacterium BMA12]|uniref:DUF6896 domain-containing protein n=1 Tax=Agaribacillus aureus TaxID=3051825 RepID=A0ABT8LI89_9BACT|nr:hypothetical protein [Fulvivirgaceae bacterium BMA12]
MNSDEKLLIEIINEFEMIISIFENKIRSTYNFTVSPLLAYTRKIIPKTGSLKTDAGMMDYNFHGRGCEVRINAKKVDFDYFGKDFRYNGFGGWKLWDFAKSVGEKYKTILNREDFFKTIENLESKNILKRTNPPYATFKLVFPLGGIVPN